MACPAFYPGTEFVRPLLATIDCHGRTIGSAGYQALAAPGSGVSLILAAALTIFVAVYGYRLLLGLVTDGRDPVAAILKVGIVLALATSWPAFRTLVYATTIEGPAELAAAIGQPSGLTGAESDLAARLQEVDGLLAELQIVGTGKPPYADQQFGPTAPMSADQRQSEMERIEDSTQRPRWTAETDQKAISQARTVFLAGAIGSYAVVRLLAGILLALGPLFAVFLLFEATRGLLEGWVRGLAGVALAGLASALVLAVQVAVVAPWLVSVVDARRAFVATPAVPTQILAVNVGFLLVLMAALAGSVRVARGFRVPALGAAIGAGRGALQSGPMLSPAGAAGASGTSIAVERTRAIAISDAVAAMQRREIAAPPPAPARLGRVVGTSQPESAARASSPAPAERRTRGRVTGQAKRRDDKR